MNTLEGMTSPTQTTRLDSCSGDENLRMAMFYTKSIYQPKNNQYFVNNADIELATEINLKRFGLATIKNLYDTFREQNQLGLRKKWTVNSIEDDLLKLMGGDVVKEPVKSGITDQQQICRYLHLIYAPTICGEPGLDRPPAPKLVALSKLVWITLPMIEGLIDHTFRDDDFRTSCYGKNIDENELKKDINKALKGHKNE